MKVAWAATASGWLVLLAGCGLAANPQPPTLWLPEPVKDLTAARVGSEVHLHWTMPKNTTDKVALKGDQRAHICWTKGDIPATGKNSRGAVCNAAGDGMFTPDKPAVFNAQLPAQLTGGTPAAVSFFVELQNHAGKTAGPSNAAWVATGAAPPAVSGFRVETRADGVLLRWDPTAAADHMVLRIHRTLITQPNAPKSNEGNGAPPPEQQVLEVDLDGADRGEAVDRDATLDHVWKYTAERVQHVTVSKRALEIAGPLSEVRTLEAKDVFPPGVPQGLAVVVDEQAKAVDLSWTPDTDADIAGYVVYRRDVTSSGAPERISGKALIVPPSFEDAKAAAGHRYAWSVSAVDQDGNESHRSGEIEEEMPQ